MHVSDTKKKSTKDALVTKVADPAAHALSAMRRSVATVLPMVSAASASQPSKELPIGEFTMIAITDIQVGNRFRKDLGDVKGMADSIMEVGLLQPILLGTDFQLISGIRRLEAHRHLGREQILARVLDVEDPVLASIEEDPKPQTALTATEEILGDRDAAREDDRRSLAPPRSGPKARGG